MCNMCVDQCDMYVMERGGRKDHSPTFPLLSPALLIIMSRMLNDHWSMVIVVVSVVM